MTIIGSLFDAVAARRNHRGSACGVNQCDERVSVIAFICNDRLRIEAFDQGGRLRNVGDFPSRQYPAEWIAQRIHRGVNLGTQPATRAPEGLRAFFFWAPAACWWARTTVLSMNSASKSTSWPTSLITRCHTPFLPQREKRVNVACQLPNAGGRSRHGEPVRAIHSTASRNNRLSFAVTPGSVALPGSKSLMRSHCSSRSRFLGIASGSQ